MERQVLDENSFVKIVHKIHKYDINGINSDLPLIICYNELIVAELLNSALKNKLVLHFDKTFNTSIYNLSTISYKSNSILARKTGAPALMLGIFLLHKSSCKDVFIYFFQHLKSLILSLLSARNINRSFESLFYICTDQEKGITSAIKETFANIDMILCKKHVTDNIPHNITDKNTVKLLKKLTTCKNQNEFSELKNVILASESFVGCNSNEKRYVYKILPLILNHIIIPLNKMCCCDNGVLCVCKPLTNNLAESANHKIKFFSKFKTGTPLEVINKLQDLINLQLKFIEKMFNDSGNFVCPDLSLPFTIHDKQLLDTLFNRFFSDEFFYSDNVVQPLPKKKRNFKTKGGSKVVSINDKYYIKSSDGKKLYPLGLITTAHKPYNGPKKTRTFQKFSNL